MDLHWITMGMIFFCFYRRRESPAQRRIDERYRGGGGEQRISEVRPNSYRDRNERGRESPPRMQRADRNERKHPEPEFRRDRRDDVNQPEWRNRDRAPGKLEDIINMTTK